MSSCTTTMVDNYIQIPMSSALMNMFNFLLFDILLATVLFWITGTIAGLENSKSAKRREQNQLFLRNPPLVGVGITCTRRSVFRWLALLRICGMAIILSTNFLIEGVSCEVETRSVQDVVVPGKIAKVVVDGKVRANKQNERNTRHYMRLRRSCQGRSPDTNEWYYGEYRYGKKCELRRHLISQKIVYYGLNSENITIPLSGFKSCTMERNETVSFFQHWKCPGFGTLACQVNSAKKGVPKGFKPLPGAFVPVQHRPTQAPGTLKSNPERCYGLVRVDKMEYMCQGGALFPGRNNKKVVQKPVDDRVASCRRARNIDTMNSDWIDLMVPPVVFRHAVDAVHGAALKKMEVRVQSPNHTQDVSLVHVSWFALVAVFSGFLLLLLARDVALRCQGYTPIAHDEIGLASLLSNSANISTYRNRNRNRNINTFAERSVMGHDRHEPGPDLQMPLMVGLTADGVLRVRAQ